MHRIFYFCDRFAILQLENEEDKNPTVQQDGHSAKTEKG